jgi:hypothetical protein
MPNGRIVSANLSSVTVNEFGFVALGSPLGSLHPATISDPVLT